MVAKTRPTNGAYLDRACDSSRTVQLADRGVHEEEKADLSPLTSA